MRLKINLATRIYIDNQRLNLGIFLVVAVSVLSLAFSVNAIVTNVWEIEKIAGEINALEGKTRGNVGEKEYQGLLAKIGAANSIIDGKTYNWLALLDKLESVVPDGVALTAIQPEPKAEGLKLNGVAGNFQALRRFVENLEGDHSFSEVYLLGQNETKVGTSQSGITFTITCRVTGK
jgi:type IV pilus assembly protein PilN